MPDGDATPQRRLFSYHEAVAPGDPYPTYVWFRRHDPVHVGRPGWPVGRPQVVLFRHADVTRWLRDPRMIRQFNKLPEVQALRKLQRWQPPGPDTFAATSRQFMLVQDPPEHTRLRRIANQAFASQVAAMRRDEIAEVVERLVEAFRREHGGEGDLLGSIAYPLPVLVAARVLGIPPEDLDHFRAWSTVVGATIDTPDGSHEAVQQRLDDATRELRDYLRALIARRRDEPGDDFISRLLAAGDAGDRLVEEEVLVMSVLMITAGHETMANVIANGTLALMRHRDQWERLAADPDLAAPAVDELLRYDSPIQFTSRIAGEDLEIEGVPVARGSEVLFMFGSANRDEAVWPDPDVLRLDRQIGRHLAFGMGIHACMGAPLARMEVEAAFRTLARVAPGMTLAGPEPSWRPVVHGLRRLDVRLGEK